MEKEFQAFLSRMILDSVELPSIKRFFRSLLLFYYLFPSSKDEIPSDKLSYIYKSLQNNMSTNLSFVMKSFATDVDSLLITYLTNTDWWWEFLLLLKQSEMTIYQLSSVHEAIMDEEDKKSSGVYFTPEPQIEFICKYSLYKRLCFSQKLKVTKRVLIEIVFLQEINKATNEELQLLSEIISNFRVIDPSCGSGLFLFKMKDIVESLLRKLKFNKIISKSEFNDYLQSMQSNYSGYDINKEHITFTKFILMSTSTRVGSEEIQKSTTELIKSFNEQNRIHYLNFLQASFSGQRKFDICIGNPPYLRHHEFDKRSAEEEIKKLEFIRRAVTDYRLKFDAKADIYVYFWIKSMTILNQDGVLGFVLSRSWYSSRFMTPINTLITKEEFILDLILELPMDPWNKAKVRTNIVFGLRNVSRFDENAARLIVWKKPLSFLLDCFSNYSQIFTDYPKGYNSKHINHRIMSEEIEEYRYTSVSTIKNLFSREHLISSPMMRLDYFLMAPFLIHDVLLKHKQKFCLLKDLGKTALGSTTGANTFFYLDEPTIAKYGLSSKYLVPMTKSPKDAVSISDFTANKKLQLLYITSDLKMEEHPNLINYLEEIQEKILERPYFRNKSKNDWYYTTLIQPDIIIPNMTFLRSFIAYNNKRLHIDKQWIGFWAYEEKWILPLLGFMNSSLGQLLREVQGTRTLGLGSLKLSLGECQYLLVLNPKLIPIPILNKINVIVKTLLSENIPKLGEKTKYTEIQEKLDKIIFIEYLGLEPSFVEKIRRTLVFEVEWRLGKSIR